jgi:adenylate cyclase
LAERFVRGENVICATNLVEDNAYRVGAPAARALVDAGSVRSYAAVALRGGARLLGIIAIYRQEVRPFTDEQIALVQNFAEQAVVAMENARLLTETREALEQQSATAEVLQVVNDSAGDLAPVFHTMLDKATRLCGAAFGVFAIYDEEHYRVVAAHGVPLELAEFVRQAVRIHPGSMPDRLRHGEDIIQVPDITALGSELRTPGLVAMIELGNARTAVWVALRKDGVAQGFVGVYRQEVRPFSDKQIALLQNFAAHAVIAMENARLITETREALEQQTATAEVLQVINSSPGDIAPVFEAMLERAICFCKADEGILTNRNGDELEVVAVRSSRPEMSGSVGKRFAIDRETVSGRVMLEARTVHIRDVNADPDYRNPRLAPGQIGTLLGVPLLREGVVVGSFSLARERIEGFTEKQIAVVESFAAQAVIAMENARLITETREALEQQTATAEVLQVINSSPGDLAPVFEAILQKAHSLCEASFGGLMIYDGERFQPVALQGVPTRFKELFEHGIRPGPGSGAGDVFGSMVKGASFLHIQDLSEVADNRWRRAAVDLAGIRTFLAVPLRKDNALLGVIIAYRQEVRPFSDKQIALLQNFAAQAVIAMENARLLGELRLRTDEVAELNRGLEARVAEQVDELGRVGRLKRFLAPQLAELIVSQGDEKILESHRREIVVVFCDLRGYTAFTETAEPEEVLKFLREYHGALGPLVSQFEGTLDQFSGDGIMVFFNDPVPCPDPAERAVKMAMAMREEAGKLIAAWRRHGCELGFGAGIAQGFATLGQIGFSERSGYTAIGTVCNLAARLCAEAKDGQILVSSHIAEAIEAVVSVEDLGNLELRGLRRPVAAFNVMQSTSPPDARPNLTVVVRGPEA